MNTESNRLSWLKRIDLWLFITCVALFTLIPQIDLSVSAWFYDAASKDFPLSHNGILRTIYLLFLRIPIPLLIILPIMSIYAWRRYKTDFFRRRIALFLLLSLLLGPGLVVNTVLKNHSIGRARPHQVEEFGGSSHFTPAFVYSGECQRNCSFVSGHAAIGFYFIGLGWLLRSPAGFWAGMLIGTLISLTRIAQGGHFFSDTVFAFWAVYFVNLILARWFQLPYPLRRKNRDD